MERKIDSFFSAKQTKGLDLCMMMWILMLHLLQRANMSLWLLILFMSLWVYRAFMAIDRLQYPGEFLELLCLTFSFQKLYRAFENNVPRSIVVYPPWKNADVPWSIVFKSFKSARVVQGVPTDTVPRDKSLRLRMMGKISECDISLQPMYWHCRLCHN